MKNLLKALHKFSTSVTPITKDANNPYFKSKYASLEHIQEHIKSALLDSGLVVVQKNIILDNCLYVETKVIHVDSGESEVSIFPVVVAKQDAQSYGSAVSYAKRYSLTGLLNLTIQDSDDDGNAAGKQTAHQNKNTEPAAPQTKNHELKVLGADNNLTKEWTNTLDAIKSKKVTDISQIEKYYSLTEEIKAKLIKLISDAK